MRCEDVERLLSGQTLAELPGVDEAAVGAHLASCPACRAKWAIDEQSQELHEAIEALRPREGAERSLLAKLDAEEGSTELQPTPPHSEMPKQLGGFEVLDLLGRGGMGSVYKARQVSLGRLVALKVISGRLAADERFLVRFEREARAAAAVHHPSIVAVYSVGEDNGRHYIAMELVAGESLGALVHREGPLPQERALGLMKQTAAALAAAHEAGIVHRDIKPSNILLAADGSAKVADFGLAKRILIDVKVTVTGTTVGTPLYMAPEAAGAKPLDARADLYSLGATFYHVLAGRPPFEGRTPVEVIVKHATEEAQSLAAVAPHLDTRLCRIIDRLLRKEPSERYPSARALLDELSALGPLQTPDEAEQAKARATLLDSPTLALSPGRRLERQAVAERLRRELPPGRNVKRLLIAAAGALVLLTAVVLLARGVGRRPSSRAAKPASSTQALPTASVEKEAIADLRGKAEKQTPREEPPHKLPGPPQPPGEWVSLFDGKTLNGWRAVTLRDGTTDLGDATGDQVQVKDGQIVLGAGQPVTGILWRGEFPATDYELRFQAKRVAGELNFADVSFLIGWMNCRLTLGGWGGTAVGLQHVDGLDLPDNPTLKRMNFDTDRWYTVQLRVTDARIEAWIDQEKVVDLPRGDHKFFEDAGLDRLRPLGILSWGTTGALRDIQVRELRSGVLKGLAAQDEPKAAVSFTAPAQARGLWPACVGDGLFVAAERDGKAVLHQQAGRPEHGFLYFWAAEGFAEQFRADANRTAFLRITLLDTVPGSVDVQYDSHMELPDTDGGRWTGAGPQELKGTGQWVEMTFPLPRARFGHRQNYGADFRLWHSGELFVHRVAVASREERAEKERAPGMK